MTDLSPQAQAVLGAFRAVPDLRDCPSIAAALRAVADQVVPEGFADAYDCCLGIAAEIRDDIFAIAAELEGME